MAEAVAELVNETKTAPPSPDAVRDADVKRALRIPGWLSEDEARLLYGLAHNAVGPIVEIGSYQGRSTACLALGSMSGRGQTVYAVDPFIGVAARQHQHGLLKCSEEQLQENLAALGISSAGDRIDVKIVPKASADAWPCLPTSIAVLFVDGAHNHASVSRDLELYLPKVVEGGFVVMHDVTNVEPGVVQAVNEHLLAKPLEWRAMDRVDSAVVFRKVTTVTRNVQLMLPGGSFSWDVMMGVVQASLGAHNVTPDNNSNGWDDFNVMWCRALTRAEAGEITHAAMLHSDVVPQAGFLDILLDEIEHLGADMISVACSLKDKRGVLNCGWGSVENRWGAFRRLTVKELHKLPPTFRTEDAVRCLKHGGSLAGKILLHNTGCWIADLRKPLWFERDEQGFGKAWFDFPTRIKREEGGAWTSRRESEDWFFSRCLHELGAKTYITRKVKIDHEGRMRFPNYSHDWCEYKDGDEETAPNWRRAEAGKNGKQD